jgi:hypothetical protein
MSKTISIKPGDYVLVDSCRFGNSHPQAWLIGIVERALEAEPQRFLIHYLTPDQSGLLHQPGLLRWTRNGGVKIDSQRRS